MRDGYELVRLRSGAMGIRSLHFEEVCHPGVGPRAEAEALYVQGLALPRRWNSHQGEFVVWDVGLGGAANAAAVIDAAAAHPVDLRVISFDTTMAQLEFALRHEAELGYLGAVAEPARGLAGEGTVAWRHGQASISWSWARGDFAELMRHAPVGAWPPPHAILYDPHSPKANPSMWTLTVLSDLFGRLAADRPCALATYSRSTAVRSALALAGFLVGSGHGTATKEETTQAANRWDLLHEPLDRRWLERARRSGAAEPWTAAPFEARPLSEESWQRLCQAPQFAGR